MKSPAVKKTPQSKKELAPTTRVRKSNSSGTVTRVNSGKIVKKTPARKGGGKGDQKPVAKGEKAQSKKVLEMEDKDEKDENSDDPEEMEATDEDISESEDSEVDNEEEAESEDDESSEEEVPLPEGSVSGDSPDEDFEPAKKTGKPTFQEDSLENKRTVFVGNLPSLTEKKSLIKWFSKFGKVESVRFRSASVADLKIPKKTAVITKAFHESATNINAYVKFADEESARKALTANGEKFDETHHLRVDSVGDPKEADCKKAIFVGNIPFDATEDELRELFDDCGDIESVRLIRDPRTHVGKGFGYVNFTERNSVQLAMQKGEVKLKGRSLRLKKANHQRLEKESHEEYGVYVANMPYDFMTEENLRDFFCDCGSISQIHIPKNKTKLRGFAIVNFTENSAVEKALKKKGEKIGDRALVVRLAGGGPRLASITNIHAASSLDALLSLKGLLRGLNDITRVDVQHNGSYTVLVGFESPNSAKTLASKNGVRLGESNVSISLVESKSTIKHQQKRKLDFDGKNKRQGFNKKARMDGKRVQKGAGSFQGVNSSKKTSEDKKIAKKNVKKLKTQKKKATLKNILNEKD